MANIYPPDYTSPVGQIRLLIPDVDTPYIFSDDQLTAFQVLSGDDLRESAAMALDTRATDLAMTLISVSTDDLRVDASKTVQALRDRAAWLRAESDGGFEVVFPDTEIFPDVEAVQQPWPWAYPQ